MNHFFSSHVSTRRSWGRAISSVLIILALLILFFSQLAPDVWGSPQQTWTTVSRFENMIPGSVNGQNGWSGPGEIISDPTDLTSGNQVLQVTDANGLLTKSLELTMSPLQQTIFFRVYRTDPFAFRAGGAAVNPFSFDSAFQTQIGSSSTEENEFVIADGSLFREASGFDPDDWYCVWIQADLNTKTYELFVQKSGETPVQLINENSFASTFEYKDAAFQSALNEFWIELGETSLGPNLSSGAVYIDDIYRAEIHDNTPPLKSLCPSEPPPTTPPPTTPPPTTPPPTTPPPTTPPPTDTFTPTPTETHTSTPTGTADPITPTFTPSPPPVVTSALSLPMVLLDAQISRPDPTATPTPSATPQSCLTNEVEPNNISATATEPVCFDQVVRGVLTPGSDETDIFLVQLDQTRDLRVTLSNLPAGHNYVLTLYNSVGNVLEQVGNADSIKIIERNGMTAGDYYVLIGYDSGPGSGQAYHLTIAPQ